MSEVTKIALLSGFTTLLSWGLGLYITPLAMDAAKKLDCVAKPDGVLRLQAEPVPYLGGVAVYLAMLLALAISVEFTPAIMGLLLGATIILLVGLIDDFGVMTPKMKLFGQAIAAIALIKSGIMVELSALAELRWPFDMPLVAWAVSAFWITGISNAVNFLDIEDGLAGGTAAGICPGLFAVALFNGRLDLAVFVAGLFGAVLGFLHYNAPVPKARIYLGDAGSLLLGVMLSALAMMGSYTQKNDLAMLCPVIILGVPCFEMAVTMTARLLKGIPVWQGSPDHIAKRLQRAGWPKERTTLAHALASLALGGVAVYIMNADFRGALVAISVLALAAMVVMVLLLRIKVETPPAKNSGPEKADEA